MFRPQPPAIATCRRSYGLSDRCGGPRELPIVQLPRHPIHLRAVSGRFLRNHNVAAPWQQTPKTLDHPIATADHIASDRRIGLVEPTGQTDPARDRINLGNGIAILGQNEIRTNDQRDIVAKLFLARKLDQRSRLPGVKISRDPGGLFAFDASLIEFVARTLENEQPMTELLDFLRECVLDWKRIGRKEKILLSEETFLREGGCGSRRVCRDRRAWVGRLPC